MTGGSGGDLVSVLGEDHRWLEGRTRGTRRGAPGRAHRPIRTRWSYGRPVTSVLDPGVGLTDKVRDAVRGT